MSARVRLFVDLEQLRGVDVRVALRGAETGVAEQFLDRPEIRPALQQVRREGMTQRVRADPHPRAAGRDVAAHQAIHAPGRQAPTAEVQEQRITGAGLTLSSLPFPPVLPM